MRKEFEKLGYDPEKLERELKPYYISATEEEISQMLDYLGYEKIEDVFSHLPSNIQFKETPNVCERLEYIDLINDVETIANKNKIKTSFLGDGLAQYKVPSIVPYVCNIRGLTTAYTPYQPERSQGTLHTLWLYSSALSMLTGFEAINASLYDRSTCLFEAFNTSLRIVRKTDTVFVSEGVYPGDLEVVQTLSKETSMNIVTIAVNDQGTVDLNDLKEKLETYKGRVGSFAFCQVNNLGILEDVNALTDLCSEAKIQSIAIIDPILLATEGLLSPSKYGSNEQGADMIVGEGQHLCLGPNYGGPGLGIFGIRFNDKYKTAIRQTAGRFVGKAIDSNNQECLAMVLSTREQHIRREKATSNICSNQSFIATIAGAAILERGEKGLTESILKARLSAIKTLEKLQCLKGIELAYEQPFYNEFTIQLDRDVDQLIELANEKDLQIGINVSKRTEKNNLLKMSFFDIHEQQDLDKLVDFFMSQFEVEKDHSDVIDIPSELKRMDYVDLPNFSSQELKDFYDKLGELNVSPDDNIYPLGSCTMKYNPYINDYAAGLKGFTDLHPQSNVEDSQGALEIIYGLQEMFKAITGLPAVTTQPVAGAQGELVGIKMFQAYHRDRGNAEKKDIILIPRSAHGTNPATATMAGYESKKVGDQVYGIISIEANDCGQIDMDQFKSLVQTYGERISGIMITNPNTSGIFEADFKEVAELIHSVDGLVYMDGANMNAIAGWVDLNELGVDAVHNNIHKTWTIPHGGGGPGDAFVAVSEKLIPYMPGIQVKKEGESFSTFTPEKTIGSFHRHCGNFAHKVRCYTYLRALGSEGVKMMSAVAVLSAQYLYKKLQSTYPVLPQNKEVTRMHEFILTLNDQTFARIQEGGTPKANAIAKVGKLFLDFGLHAPTVAFPEVYGLMVEPTESFSKKELDDFVEVVETIHTMINENPEVLTTAPHFTPVSKVDEVYANKNLILSETITSLPSLPQNKVSPKELSTLGVKKVYEMILQAHNS
ncbi:aminomethyl-transferring glycine dehydrogenase subunit GcvPB [Halobacteriovorax sp. GB3]|uniref:aminomethyl-transferring glycine dehydrogenase subunit GcvPB n=1 Tax=Halobacteriovorax sp. GB3 TaxID=2719615 RepID=UPI00235DD40C|nr:aminomethyl-transferring glycine dehydrogenase subunit GcvPB [Halobacteriovorax sp. GB3]MDD0852808.1 aminomethyl-transferring glycine dehydrogenase subunit GcvPB [Halobacteriovorax sp. GB3]